MKIFDNWGTNPSDKSLADLPLPKMIICRRDSNSRQQDIRSKKRSKMKAG
jgi:hypothetical protein